MTNGGFLIASTPAAEIITAIGACTAAVLGAIGAFLLSRSSARQKQVITATEQTAEATATVANTVGEKNGRGDMITMLRDLQDALSDSRREATERANVIDKRLLRHEEAIDTRLEALHAAIIAVRGRVHHLEQEPTPDTEAPS